MKQKKHILFLCGWYPSRVFPYNGDFIQRHAEAVSSNYQVSVLHLVSDANCKKSTHISHEIKNTIQTHIAYIKPSKNPIIKGIRFYIAFQKLLKNIGYFDLVHLNKLYPFGIFALYLKWVKKKNYIISEHWTGYHPPLSKNISNISLFLSRLIAKNASFICPVSFDLKKSMETLKLYGNYKVVPNVVDTSLFIPQPKKERTFTILHISNMVDTHKNVSGIIKTMATLNRTISNFKLILIGEGVSKYKPLAISLHIASKIEFISQIPHHKVPNFIQKADIFVLFSNYENLPCVILESFSCGTPVITTNVGGISEFFPDDFGKLIAPKKEDELLKNILFFYHKKEQPSSEKMHQYVVKHFSKEAICKSFSNLYKISF
ncbi:glycosyltransferase family 4 protein [Tenacibaculum maritimum]|uniref:glycosyltransferase family 4 protein n=1 Tax=Tenacibaculum maritimum TaxID=107401 RepID=UPI00388F3326